ncbi:hypothetical protein GOP47_0023449 [Adiantum capillus-veneris]|uniref:CobQ/CobB/MinD/ParA nucleotide binding domain-containing protein n=1 Tax=Adiantum capillus-veneris TaxID=13818 RepID=A0A9D4U5P6_ADICA|nr:hypothetical protein GOP47_0023449 [Adiantum capillus-veneris]
MGFEHGISLSLTSFRSCSECSLSERIAAGKSSCWGIKRLLSPVQHPCKVKAFKITSVLQWNRRPQLAGQVPRVVVITSGKGGVGKTTTTANIGLCLARLDFKVVAIDADVGLRNLDLLLGLENRVNYTAMEVLNGECRLDQALIRDKRWTNLELLCINKPRYKMPLGFGGKALTWLVDALKKRPEGSPDFILIDCPAGIDAGFITAITPANEAVLVTTPDITSLRDADRVTGLLECDGIKDIKMIVNRVRSDMIKGEDMMSVLDVQEMLGLPLLGVIPEDAEVIRSSLEVGGTGQHESSFGRRGACQEEFSAILGLSTRQL